MSVTTKLFSILILTFGFFATAADTIDERVASMKVKACGEVRAFRRTFLNISHLSDENGESLRADALRRIPKSQLMRLLLKASIVNAEDRKRIRAVLRPVRSIVKNDRVLLEKRGGQTILTYELRQFRHETKSLDSLEEALFDRLLNELQRKLKGWRTEGCQ